MSATVVKLSLTLWLYCKPDVSVLECISQLDDKHWKSVDEPECVHLDAVKTKPVENGWSAVHSQVPLLLTWYLWTEHAPETVEAILYLSCGHRPPSAHFIDQCF